MKGNIPALFVGDALRSGNHDANVYSPRPKPLDDSRNAFSSILSLKIRRNYLERVRVLMSLHASRHVYFNIISLVVSILVLLANCLDKLALTDLGTLPSSIAVFLLNRQCVCVCACLRTCVLGMKEREKRARENQH